jgi:hypothetical protein
MNQIAIEYVHHSQLNPATYNPRKISPEAMAKLKKGIREFGVVDPLIINRDGTIIGGHQRMQAGLELGHVEFPCIRLDVDKRREKALNLALNKLSGDWDYDKLSVILSEFEADPQFDIELTGFDNVEMLDVIDIGDPAKGALSFYGSDGSFQMGGDSGDAPGVDGATASTPKGITIQYTIIFDDEEQQQAWHAYLRELKGRYPEMETISARLIADIASRAMEA